jgi:hypothetical protein
MPSPALQKIKNRLLGKETTDDIPEIIRIHHVLMREYGWIPLEEFKLLPMQTIDNLLKCISEDKKAEEKAYKKMRKK